MGNHGGVIGGWRGARQPQRAFTLQGPAAALSAQTMQRLVGQGVSFQRDATARRLSLTLQGHAVQGLPALCVALSRRNGVVRLLALCAAPVALAVENMREALDVA